jgi:hypothetical protein
VVLGGFISLGKDSRKDILLLTYGEVRTKSKREGNCKTPEFPFAKYLLTTATSNDLVLNRPVQRKQVGANEGSGFGSKPDHEDELEAQMVQSASKLFMSLRK